MENEQQTSQDLSVKDIEREMKKLELERARQALESQKIQDELNRLMLEDKRRELETRTNNKKRGAEDAKKAIEDLRAQQARCNHRTGGQGAEAILLGQGDAKRPTCIGAQVFLDERIRLVCGRCRAECWSDDPDRNKWAYWVGLWKESINQQMMVIGGLKITKTVQAVA
jgi:hypothetical protein